MRITFEELEALGCPSVTDYCRRLVEGGTPEGTIEVYRGDMLCLTVTDIAEAAKIMPTGTGFIKYDPTKRGRASKGSLQPRGCV